MFDARGGREASLLFVVGSDQPEKLSISRNKFHVVGSTDIYKLLGRQQPYHRLQMTPNYFRQARRPELGGYTCILNLITEAEQNAAWGRGSYIFTCTFEDAPDAWMIENVATLPRYRGRGLAAELIAHVLPIGKREAHARRRFPIRSATSLRRARTNVPASRSSPSGARRSSKPRRRRRG